MARTEARNENCTPCVHFGYCIVYWGANCKRQGGNRIPRMKPTPDDILEKMPNNRSGQIQISLHKPDAMKQVNRQKTDKSQKERKPDMITKISKMFDPIRTRVANW